MDNKEKSKILNVRVSSELDAAISRIADKQGRTKSEVLRDLIRIGIRAQDEPIDQDRLYDIIKSTFDEVSKPGFDRIAAITAKATQIDAASFFMFLYTLTRDGSREEQTKIEEAVESARRLGIQYLKLKDRDIDSFLSEGVKQIKGTS